NGNGRAFRGNVFGGLKRIADSLGSDCGYMLTGGWARITGRGEIVKRLNCGLKLDIGLLVPRGGVSTAECYRLCDSLPRGGRTSGAAEGALASDDKLLLCKSLSNGLTSAAVRLNGEVGECIEELKEFDPLGVNMTGSGSGVYAVFENDQFLRYAQSRYRGKYEFIPTRTIAVREERDG
ncbi:MAG: hypothetical protein K2J54_05305, partial [Clostridia bacterium]|nr:hypothetical protein [Clostridia bacterium]